MGGTVGWYRWAGGKLKWRQLAQSLNEGRFTLVHTEKLKPMIKGTISRRMLSSGISHVAFASVYSEKTRMKKCWIMIIGERAKRARHSQVCSIENRIYIITRKMVPIMGRAS